MVLKEDVIDLGFGLGALRTPMCAWYPINQEIARETRRERACHGVFFAYDYRQKNNESRRKRT
jgi:hypothetical protein